MAALAGTLYAAEPQDVTRTWAPLDGWSFHGKMVSPEGHVVSAEEKLVFSNGRFASEACRKFGFRDAPYWVRVEGDTIHFLAETASEENGTMRWVGTVTDGKVNASLVWTKHRWYWTIEREFRVHATRKR